jgi:prepilin signal peptidase PulO-like enzyme (type II secretory pathway)
MGRAGIDRKLVRIAAVISIPLELVALFGLYPFLMDAASFSGGSQWWVAYGMVGFYVNFLGVLLISSMHTPRGADLLIIPFLGYANVFFQVIVVALGFRVIRELCSTRCTNHGHQHRRIEPLTNKNI